MTHTHTTQDENFSALMDGELHGSAQHLAMVALLSEAKARSTWHAYHVMADVLRSEELSDAAQDLQFWTKLESRLAQEPLPSMAPVVIQSPSQPPLRRYFQSANGPVFWRALAGVACSALVAIIGISVWSPSTGPSSDSVAVVVAPAVVSDGMMLDPRLDQLLSAHQQLGGHSALQMPSGFLRNATYEGAGR